MTHERWSDSVASYLLGALPDDEREGFESHLAECAVCQDEAAHLSVAADALPVSAEQIQAPPELKDRIMSVVRSEAQLLNAAGARADVPERAPRAERRRWWSMRPALAFAGAAAALAIGVVAGGAITDGEDSPATRTVVAQVQSGVAEAHLELGEDKTELVARGLPNPGRDRVYQVWLKRPGKDPQPTDALFTTGRDGSATVRVPGSLEGVEAVLVTREPEGGSKVPSEAPYITASIA